MISTLDLPQLSSALLQHQDCPPISHYLNGVLALDPPLQVRGQPPLLHIHLPAVHLSAIGQLIPQLEQALRSLHGSRYWDVHIFTDDGISAQRHIYHCLLEKTSSPLFSVTAPAAAELTDRQATAPPAPQPLAPLVSPWRQRSAARQRAHRRHQWLIGLAVLIGTSFFGGIWLAGGNLRDRPGTNWSLPPAESRPATIDEPPREPVTASAADRPGNSVIINALPPLPGKPLNELATAADSMTTATGALSGSAAGEVAVQIKAVGDIIPGTDFPDSRLPSSPNYLFDSVKMYLGEVDILFGNFESTLTDYPFTAKNLGSITFAFRTPPAYTDVLKTAGFDVLSVANNHSFDFGDPGFNDTIANIEQSGMLAVGRKDSIVTVDANGLTVAFIGFSYWPDHNNMNDLATATALVQTAQTAADLVVISVHAGAEGTDALRVRDRTEYFFSENRGNMVQFSRAMVDAGADLILGHGPHVPRAIELYKNKLIAYSLGNFLGYRTLSTVGPLGLSMILQADLSAEGDFVQGRVIPVALDDNGVPYIDNQFATVTLVRQLTAQDFPQTPLAIDQMGYIFRTD